MCFENCLKITGLKNELIDYLINYYKRENQIICKEDLFDDIQILRKICKKANLNNKKLYLGLLY